MKRTFLWIALCVMWTLAAPWASAQDETSSSTQDASAEERPAATTLDRSRIEAALDAANALEVVEGDERRARLIQTYSSALALIDARDEWETLRQQYLDAAETAPQRTAEIEAQLERDPEPPTPIDDDSIESLEAARTAAELDVEATRTEVAGYEDFARNAPERRIEIVDEIAEVEAQIAGQSSEVSDLPVDGVDELDAAGRILARATSEEQRARLASLRAKEATLDARRGLAEAELRLARRKFTRVVAQLEGIEDALSRERLAEARSARDAARVAQSDAAGFGQTFQRVAEDTLGVRSDTVDITASLGRVRAQLQRARESLDRLSERFLAAQSRVEIAGLTSEVGRRLRQDRQRLLETRAAATEFAGIDARLRATQVEVFDVELLLESLAGEQAWVDQLVVTSEGIAPTVDVQAEARGLLSDLRSALVAKRNALSERFRYLTDLREVRESLDTKLGAYEEFVAERILWIRSSDPIWAISPDRVGAEVAIARDSSSAALEAILGKLRGRLPVALLIASVLGVLWAIRPRVRHAIAEEGELAEQRSQTSIRPTLRALFWTLVHVVPYAATWYALAWFVGSLDRAASYEAAIGAGCDHAAAVAIVLGMLRALTVKKGLCESHFEWTAESVALLRRQAKWLVPVMPAAAFVAEFLASIESSSAPGMHAMELLPSADVEGGQALLSRAAFVVEFGALLVFLRRILHPSRGVLALATRATGGDDWLTRLRRLWFIAGVGVVALLIVITLLGYEFTARSLFDRVLMTFGYLIALFVLRAMALRWVRLERRHEALEKLRRKREELREKRLAEIERRRNAGEDVEELESEGLEVPTDEVDFASLSSDVRDVVRMSTGIAGLVGVALIWIGVLPALGVLDSVHLWMHSTTSTLSQRGPDGIERTMTVPAEEWITLGDLLWAGVMLLLTWRAVKDLPSLLEIVLLRRLDLGSGERYAVTTLLRYLLTVVGLAIAFHGLGLSWSKLQWLVAGVSVGLGFGLQEIFANFVSGITLLFERPIRVGDWVTLGDIEGVVSKIRIRATTIRDRDLKELVVPNREFITGRFINWTLSDQVSRVVLPIGIAYGSDTERAIQLLLDAGRDCPYTVPEPAPNVVFKSFGESSLDFELRVFVNGREIMPRVVHDLHMRVDASFRRAEIEISFPQRDLHLRSAVGLDVSPA